MNIYKKTALIQFRVTPEDKEDFEKAAKFMRQSTSRFRWATESQMMRALMLDFIRYANEVASELNQPNG
jgi:uncharacterized protein (DUF1778 family)